MRVLYTINRSGVCLNRVRCGFEGDTQIEYAITVGVHKLILDEEKFLIDHDDLAKLAVKTIRFADTCEIAAQDLLRAVHKAVKKRFNPAYIRVQVGAHQGSAFFTAETIEQDMFDEPILSTDPVDNIRRYSEPTINDPMDI